MKPFQKKTYQKNEVDRLKEELRLALIRTPKVEKLLADLEHARKETKSLTKMYAELSERYREAMTKATRYEDLRDLEVLVMDKEGVKNLTGQALDDYCDRRGQQEIQSIMERSVSTSRARSLAASMQRTKDAIVANLMLEQLRKANDSRSKS